MQKKKYSKVGLFFRSLIVWIISTILICIYGMLVFLSGVLPMHYRHAIIRSYLSTYIWMLKVICHVDYRLEGAENIPKDHTGIVMSKHQSTWETYFLPILFHNPAIILKREILWVPFFGWGLAAAGPIAIDRSNKRSAMQQILDKGTACLKSGRWIIMFPEGTRTPSGQIGQYKIGGARLAAASGFPVIPVAHNAGRYWARRTFIKQPGTIRVVVGPPIESKNKKPEEVLAETKNWIENKMREIDPASY